MARGDSRFSADGNCSKSTSNLSAFKIHLTVSPVVLIFIYNTMHIPDGVLGLVANVYGHSWVIKVEDDSPYITERELNSGNRDS